MQQRQQAIQRLRTQLRAIKESRPSIRNSRQQDRIAHGAKQQSVAYKLLDACNDALIDFYDTQLDPSKVEVFEKEVTRIHTALQEADKTADKALSLYADLGCK